MFLNDRNSTRRLRINGMLLSTGLALAMFMVFTAMDAGLASTSYASEMIDQIHTSAIAAAPISKASDRIFVIALVVTGFITMAIGGIILTLNSIRETTSRRHRD